MAAGLSSRGLRGSGVIAVNGRRARPSGVDDGRVLPVTPCGPWRFAPGYESGGGGDLAGWVLSLSIPHWNPGQRCLTGATMFSGILAPETAMPRVNWRWCAEIDCSRVR